MDTRSSSNVKQAPTTRSKELWSLTWTVKPESPGSSGPTEPSTSVHSLYLSHKQCPNSTTARQLQHNSYLVLSTHVTRSISALTAIQLSASCQPEQQASARQRNCKAHQRSRPKDPPKAFAQGRAGSHPPGSASRWPRPAGPHSPSLPLGRRGPGSA